MVGLCSFCCWDVGSCMSCAEKPLWEDVLFLGLKETVSGNPVFLLQTKAFGSQPEVAWANRPGGESGVSSGLDAVCSQNPGLIELHRSAVG